MNKLVLNFVNVQDKEVKIKRALNRVKENRELLRRDRKRRECPTVAVVGYTNAGKKAYTYLQTNGFILFEIRENCLVQVH